MGRGRPAGADAWPDGSRASRCRCDRIRMVPRLFPPFRLAIAYLQGRRKGFAADVEGGYDIRYARHQMDAFAEQRDPRAHARGQANAPRRVARDDETEERWLTEAMIRIGSPQRVVRRLAIRYVRLYISLGRTEGRGGDANPFGKRGSAQPGCWRAPARRQQPRSPFPRRPA